MQIPIGWKLNVERNWSGVSLFANINDLNLPSSLFQRNFQETRRYIAILYFPFLTKRINKVVSDKTTKSTRPLKVILDSTKYDLKNKWNRGLSFN